MPIFKVKCVTHPKYKGKLKPRVECEACEDIYYGTVRHSEDGSKLRLEPTNEKSSK